GKAFGGNRTSLLLLIWREFAIQSVIKGCFFPPQFIAVHAHSPIWAVQRMRSVLDAPSDNRSFHGITRRPVAIQIAFGQIKRPIAMGRSLRNFFYESKASSRVMRNPITLEESFS